MIGRSLAPGLLLLAWGCSVAAPTPPPSTASAGPALRRIPSALQPAGEVVQGDAYLFGTVNAPARLISADGASVISNNGGSLTTIVRVPVISDQGGSVISNNGAGFGLLGLPAGPEGSLRGAFLVLADRDERFFRNRHSGEVFTTTTDAEGRYLFPIAADNGFPVGKDVVVTAVLAGGTRLSGYLSPQPGPNRLKVDLATTLATELLRGEAQRRERELGDFEVEAFYQAAVLTQEALAKGEIEATREDRPVFDLRADGAERLRNQYVVAMSAAAADNALLHALSDAWTRLLGQRPSAVTTVLDDAIAARVAAAAPPAGPVASVGAAVDRASQLIYSGVATSPRGDVFVANELAPAGFEFAWQQPDGTIVPLRVPPSADLRNGLRPLGVGGIMWEDGALVVASALTSRILRVPVVAPGGAQPPVELVAGALAPIGRAEPPTDPAHPYVVDGPEAYPLVADRAAPRSSSWRLADEGERTYRDGKPVPQPARFAFLGNPKDVKADELGNLYIADTKNHRIRMLPRQAGNYFGYRQPLDDDGDGVVDRFGEAVTMQPGCLYTIAGNPRWDPARAHGLRTSPWFGEYGGDGGPAQEARLDRPVALAWHAGRLYVADQDNQRVRVIAREGGRIETLAGDPGGQQRADGDDFAYPPGWGGDGGPAARARLNQPTGLAIDARDPARPRLFIADAGNGRIRMVELAEGEHRITAVAGRGPGAAGDLHREDGEARGWADLLPGYLALDAAGNLLVSCPEEGRLRKVWRPWE